MGAAAQIGVEGRESARTLDDALHGALREALGVGWLVRERLGARRRRKWGMRGVPVPPVMALSLSTGRAPGGPTRERMDRMLREAGDMGVSVILLNQGEPLLWPDLLDLAGAHDRIVFPFFTNGLLLSDPIIRRLRRQRHLLPVLGLDGLESQTDRRRGTGFYRLALERARALRAQGVFFGVSLTATTANLHLLAEDTFVDGLLALGARVFFVGEYEPVMPGTENLVLDATQRRALGRRLQALGVRSKAHFVSYPDQVSRFGAPLDGGGRRAPYVMDLDSGSLREAFALLAEGATAASLLGRRTA